MSKMPGLPALTAFILLRTIRRLVALNCTKIANQGLTMIPNSANTAINGNKTWEEYSQVEGQEKQDGYPYKFWDWIHKFGV